MEVEFKKRDILVFCLVLSIAFFLLGIFTSDLFNGKAIKVSSEKLVPIYRVDTDEKKVAITLDGMWGGSENTGAIADF